ncbi:MAG: CCA tRNA nucleotidyltransferase [Acidobacteriota bacterium]|nr:CCA tRNA nucleotidyltransferase [Acidobacteriota bacterium]
MQIPSAQRLFAQVQALAAVASILDDVEALGADVYLVGGAVRDLILGRRLLDIDLAIDGEPLRLATALGDPEGAQTRFGTLSVIRGGVRYDLVRTRSERYPHPGALPEVAPAGIEADLARRDFTVNALALGLGGSRTGELIAANGALSDLEQRQLAVLHDGSFSDDPTRLLRLARYCARLGFEPAPHTRELADAAIAGDALATLSGTRLGNELRLLATEPDSIAAFEAVAALGMPWALDPDATRRALDVLPDDGRADRLVLASVFGTLHQPQLNSELDRLGFTATDRDAIAEGATQASDLARRLAKTTSRSEIARTVGTAGIETVALAFSRGSPSQSLTWLHDLRHLKLDITGEDLIDNSIPEGPVIGEALARARDALYNGTAPDRDSQLKVALSAAR